MVDWGAVLRAVISSGNYGRVSLVGFAMSNAYLRRKA
jgi:hypothetical protein